jgi:spore coat protein U-like protein
MLQYNLYTTPSLNVVWGDGTAGTSTIRLKNVKRQKPPVVTTIPRHPHRHDHLVTYPS